MDGRRQSQITNRINADIWTPSAATVLIIDDDLDVRLLVRIVLGGAGFAIVGEASNGVDGLRMWRDLAGPPHPDVVILDNQMPGMAGLEVAARILEERPSQIIVMCTSVLNYGVETEAAELGVADCLPKRDIRLLPTVVEWCINNGRGGSSQEPGGDGSDSDLSGPTPYLEFLS